MSKLIAHRGWSIGKGDGWQENTISAFDKSAQYIDYKIDGIEIDIRLDTKTGEIVLSHDPLKQNPNSKYTTLTQAVQYAKERNWVLLIELKESSAELFTKAVDILQEYDMQEQAIIFGFSNVMHNIDWQKERPVLLGIVTEYPWQIKNTIKQYKPDVLVLGWDPERAWTRIAFKLYWNIFSLRKIAQRYSVQLFSGVASSKQDIKWLQKHIIDYYSADLDQI